MLRIYVHVKRTAGSDANVLYRSVSLDARLISAAFSESNPPFTFLVILPLNQ